MDEFSVGQVFEGDYPPEAAWWCNDNECAIVEGDPLSDGTRTFAIEAAPAVVTLVRDPAPTREELAAGVAELADMMAAQSVMNDEVMAALAEIGDAVAALAGEE